MHINRLGVNLARKFDGTLAHRAPNMSNVSYDTRPKPMIFSMTLLRMNPTIHLHYFLFGFLIELYITFCALISLCYSSESDSVFEGEENLNTTDYTNNNSFV